MSEIKEECGVAKIRELNDKLRRNLEGGKLVLTRGIIDREDIWQIIAKVATFSEFDNGNDPHREHDFGAFEMSGETIFWKIDYFDVNLKYASPDPTDPAVTTRVLTVMRADEY